MTFFFKILRPGGPFPFLSKNIVDGLPIFAEMFRPKIVLPKNLFVPGSFQPGTYRLGTYCSGMFCQGNLTYFSSSVLAENVTL
jgi:hypothetical protein